jgi:phage major head subunit gpT-like protein
MPSVHVESSATLTGAIRDDFWDTYEGTYEGVEKLLQPLVEFVPSTRRSEEYAFYESAPHPRRWVRGKPASAEGFGSNSFSVANKDWVVGVGWHRNDLDDDLTRSLKRRARQSGRNFAILHERIIFQLLLAATDPELLEAIPNAPDGLALFSSSARFGNANGNIVSGGGVASAAAIQGDVYKARARARSFLDTKGQPLWSPSLVDQDVIVIYGSDNEKVFREAFFQERTHSVVSTTGAAVTNIILQSGVRYILIGTSRITDNDWFVAFPAVPVKPFLIQTRQDIREAEFTMENDSHAARTKEEGLQWDARYGYGLNLPYGFIKIDN